MKTKNQNQKRKKVNENKVAQRVFGKYNQPELSQKLKVHFDEMNCEMEFKSSSIKSNSSLPFVISFDLCVVLVVELLYIY